MPIKLDPTEHPETDNCEDSSFWTALRYPFPVEIAFKKELQEVFFSLNPHKNIRIVNMYF